MGKLFVEFIQRSNKRPHSPPNRQKNHPDQAQSTHQPGITIHRQGQIIVNRLRDMDDEVNRLTLADGGVSWL
jgi:hypothetical protein